MIFRGPFQLLQFCDSLISRNMYVVVLHIASAGGHLDGELVSQDGACITMQLQFVSVQSI